MTKNYHKKYELTKEQLQSYLEQGLSTRDIEKIIGMSSSNIRYWIHKYDLTDKINLKYQKSEKYQINKIDTKEKAYMLGFIACDGCIDKNSNVELCVCKADREVLDFIAKYINQRIVLEDNSFDKSKKRFPRVRFSRHISDIQTFIGGPSKKERHLPIVKDEFTRYVLLGAFDADGCITWGRRKDKNRIWHKISFTSSYNLCLTIQKILIKYVDVSSVIRPKTNCDCFVLEVCDKKSVLKILDFLYPDDSFVILKRKYYKQKALRLELEENGGTTDNPVLYRAEPTE